VRWLRAARRTSPRSPRLQSEILEALWPLLAPGGRLLYATCSVFRSEGSERIDAFFATPAAPPAARLDPQSPGHLLPLPDNAPEAAGPRTGAAGRLLLRTHPQDLTPDDPPAMPVPPVRRRLLQGLGLLLALGWNLQRPTPRRAGHRARGPCRPTAAKGALTLEFQVRIALPRAVEEALLHGVPVYFVADAELKRQPLVLARRACSPASCGAGGSPTSRWTSTWRVGPRRPEPVGADPRRRPSPRCRAARGWKARRPGAARPRQPLLTPSSATASTRRSCRARWQIGLGGQGDLGAGRRARAADRAMTTRSTRWGLGRRDRRRQPAPGLVPRVRAVAEHPPAGRLLRAPFSSGCSGSTSPSPRCSPSSIGPGGGAPRRPHAARQVRAAGC